MGFGCGFDIYPRLEANDSNIEKYGFLIRSIILKYEDVYDDDSRHPEGRVLDIATESGSHFGTNYNLSFLVGEIPRMPVDADRCNYFLRFSSKVSGWLTAPAEPYILEVCKMVKFWFPDRVHFWHELAEGVPREKSDGYYSWDEVNKAEEELRQLTKDELSY